MTKSETKKSEPVSAPPPGPIQISIWGLALFLGCRLIEIFLAAQSMAGAVGQAVLVEYGCSRLGIAWSDSKQVVTTAIIARRIGIGAAIGFGVCVVLFAILILTHAVEIVSVPSVEASILVIGFITAALTAWRDELLHHGVVIHALDQMGPKALPQLEIIKLLACGATSAGAALGRGDADPKQVFAAALLGVVFGSVWIRDRGAWQPWAASTAFRFSMSTLLAGGVVHTKIADNGWAGGAAGILGGVAATVALAPLSVLAVGLTLRGRKSPRSSEEG